MKDLSKEELVSVFVLSAIKILKADKENDSIYESHINEIISRLSAGEEAVKKVAELEKEVERLSQWKTQMLIVESSWDVQAIGKLLNLKWGDNIRKNIEPEIQKLKQQAAAGQRAVEKYNELISHVETKHPNETRHETAIRYIIEKERKADQQSKEAGNG